MEDLPIMHPNAKTASCFDALKFYFIKEQIGNRWYDYNRIRSCFSAVLYAICMLLLTLLIIAIILSATAYPLGLLGMLILTQHVVSYKFIDILAFSLVMWLIICFVFGSIQALIAFAECLKTNYRSFQDYKKTVPINA
jgi:hypothetical protein